MDEEARGVGEALEVVVALETAVAVEGQGVAASEAGAAAVEVVDSAGEATRAQAVSHEAAVVVGVASAGDAVRRNNLSRCAFSQFYFGRWDIQNLPRLGTSSAFGKRKGGSVLSERFKAKQPGRPMPW